MKSNLEISLKFWITMIVFFAVVLSIPAINYFNSNYSMKQNDIIALMCVVNGLLLISFISVLLRYKELKSKFNKETFFKDVSMQTIEDYETQIKEQEDHIKELKKSFEDAVVEITELRSKNKQLDDTNNILIEKFKYWKERALHKKHTKKEVESELFEYTGESNSWFRKGNKYKSTKKHENKDLIFVIAEDGKEYLDSKIYFKPVK